MSAVPRFLVPTTADATAVLRRLARAGWQTREGFALAEAAWDVSAARLVVSGRVADLDTAQLAVHAAARGAGVVAVVDTTGELGQALLADLARIGPVRCDAGSERGAGPEPATGSDAAGGPPLTPQQRALLERLASGETIAGAAAAEFLSLRTANRRIAQAREALGVRTTREAVLAYLRYRRG